MFDQFPASYQPEPNVDVLDPHEGVADQQDYFDISLPDEEITKVLNERINDSRAFWNDEKGFNLRNRRERNMRFLIGDQWSGIPLLQYHVPYVQNEIWTAQNVTSAHVTSRLPELESYPSQDTPESRALSHDVASLIRNHDDEHNMQGILVNLVHSMQNNYVGYIYLEWDEHDGEFGNIKPCYLDPTNVIIEKRAKQGENPMFVCITKQASSDELIAQFPNKKKEIIGLLNDRKAQAVITYREVWCTYYEDGEPYEGVVWYFDNLVLSKKKNPHWIYDEESEGVTNLLPYPMKPIIPFNFINDGSHWIDRSGPIDQAIPLQMMINRIGKNIQENIAHSSPVLVFNKRALDKPEADKVTGQPWEKILVDADDVNKAYGVIQANQVPAYVVNEIERLKGLVHEIFGTPPQLRGESGQQTATQDLMARDQAEGRQELLVRAIDRGMSLYYRYLLQMMKVYYTEEHYASVLGDDGRYDFVAINRHKIEDGLKVKVKAGSTLPFNKARMEKIALDLASAGRIANLSLYEFLDIPNPGKHVERWIKEQVDISGVVEDIKNDEQDKNAVQDYEMIKAGEIAPPRDDVDLRHITTHQKQLVSDEFINEWDDDQKTALAGHIQAELDKLKLLNEITDEALYAEAQQEMMGAPMGPEAMPPGAAPETPPPQAAGVLAAPAPSPAMV